MLQVSSNFRLLSSFIFAWRIFTIEILDIKKEILLLQNVKKKIILKSEEKDRAIEIENQNIEVAYTFRNATLKAEIFCSWAEK